MGLVKMNEEERIKLEIQHLQSQSDYQKFEYGQYGNYFIGIIAILISIFIPTLVYTADRFNGSIALSLLSLEGFLFILLIFSSYDRIIRSSRKNLDKISKLSKEIDRMYKEIIK